MTHDEITKLITNGKIEEATDKMLLIAKKKKTTLQKPIQILTGRYRQIKMYELKGIRSTQELTALYNQVLSSMLDLNDSLFEATTQEESILKQQSFALKWLIIPILFAIIVIAVFTKRSIFTVEEPPLHQTKEVVENASPEKNELEKMPNPKEESPAKAIVQTPNNRPSFNTNYYNKNEDIEIAIIVVDKDGSINRNLGAGIAAVFKDKGYPASVSVFRNAFFTDGYLSQLRSNDLGFIRNSGLSKYLEYICLVQIKEKERKEISTKDLGLLSDDATLLEVKIYYQYDLIKVSNASNFDSFATSFSGKAINENEAIEASYQKFFGLLNQKQLLPK